MRILLHIGTHKTGTTSIQTFCARNRTRLADAGLWYPDYDLIGAEGHYAHHHLAHAIAGLATSRGQYADAIRFFDEMRRRAGGDGRPVETVLISAEPFYRHVYPPVALLENEYPSDLGEEAYLQQRRAYIARVSEAVGGGDGEIVVVLRRQDVCAESMFKERVKGMGYAEPFSVFRTAFAHRFRYFDQLSAWAEYFPKLHVLVYEDLCATGNLIGAFFDALGVSLPAGLETAPRSNTSLSNDLIEYKRLLNGGILSADELYGVAEVMSAERFRDGMMLDEGSTFWETAECRASFLSDFTEQNARVLQRFTALKREALFPMMAVAHQRPYAGLSPETSRQIAARLAAFQAN